MKNKEKITFSLKIFIPLVIVIMLFFTGISFAIISFQPPDIIKDQGNVNVKIIIDFNDGTVYEKIVLIDNATVLDLLLITAENADMDIEKTYWEQFDSYFIDSISFKGKKYESGTNSYWAFYINDEAALQGADKILVNNNDIILWKFESFK